MASGDAVQQIKDRLNILDVVGQYVELHRAGKHFKGRCPFHGEKTPSFHVSPERGTYHCFGCGVGGDIFSFIEAIDGVDFKEALKTLAQKAGVELVPEAPEKRTEREALVASIEAATKFFETQLPHCAEAVAYLEKRGVTKETIAKWRIGYAPGPPTGGWRELKSYLNAEGFKDALLLQAGLIKSADSGKEPFDVFRDRIMFPMRDQSGRVVAFSGRILHPDEKSPKYVNSPETILYHKSELLYGYDMAKHNLRQLPFWLIVEGQFDVVMSHQAGYTTAVAVSGTALTDHHVSLLERMSKNVVLALDADKAGINAMKKAADLMLKRGMDVKVAHLPDGSDPADMVQKDQKAFKQIVGQSVHVIEFFLQHLKQLATDDRAYKLKVREEVIPLIALLPNRIDQDHFEGIAATALQTSKDAIHYEVERLRTPTATKVGANESAQSSNLLPSSDTRQGNIEAYLLAATQVLLPEEGQVVKSTLETILGTDIATLQTKQASELVRDLTFRLETHFESLAPHLRREEVIHKLNELRTMVYKSALQRLRSSLDTETADTSATLEQITLLTHELRKPPLDTSIFGVR
jgi:DNA primase